MTEVLYAPSRPAGREIARPIPADLVRPPRFYWPAERHLTPSHCGNCGARLLLTDAPSAAEKVVDVDCWRCSRTACELAYDGMRRPLTPAEWRALPACNPGRGRPPKGVTP